MFETFTQRLIKNIDNDGSLIAVSRLNDSRKLNPLAVVLKCPKVWFWQTTKYRPTDFTFNDLLLEKLIQPELEKTEFVSYNEICQGMAAGFVEAGVNGASVKAAGRGTSRLNSSFMKLQKESVKLQKLLTDSHGSKVDLQHTLVQQTLKRSKRSFTIVVERIFTTQDCPIEYRNLKEGACYTALKKMLGFGTPQVYLREISNLHYDKNVHMEIPPGTVMAFSVINLNIDDDGQCVLSPYPEGYESDDISTHCNNLSEVDGVLSLSEIQEGSFLSSLKNELESVNSSLCVLTHLSSQSRSSLLYCFRQIMVDHTHLSALDDKLHEMRSGDAASSSHPSISTILNLLLSEPDCTNGLSTMPSSHNGSLSSQSSPHGHHPAPACLNGCPFKVTAQNGSHSPHLGHNGSSMRSAVKSHSLLTAVHMLVSAAGELTDDGVSLLEHLCSLNLLNELKDLVDLLTVVSEPLCTDLPVSLQDEDTLQKVEHLFISSNILLRREGQKLKVEIGWSDGPHPLVLCIVILCLAYLSEV